jgi:hypothetical protein
MILQYVEYLFILFYSEDIEMMRSILFICLFSSLCIPQTKKLSLLYIDEANKRSCRITFIEDTTKDLRTFSEKYDLFLIDKSKLDSAYNNPELYDNLPADLSYTDRFFYVPIVGLFRVFNPYQLVNKARTGGPSFLQAVEWLSKYSFTNLDEYNKLSQKTILIRYIKLYLPDTIATIPPEPNNYSYLVGKSESGEFLDAEQVRITGHSLFFSPIFEDTLRTLKFEIRDGSAGYREYKTYDSQFNLINYTWLPDQIKRDSICYQVKLDDYKRLKEFRKDLKPIFRN